MLQQLKNMVYGLIVDSGFIYFFMPLIKRLALLFLRPAQQSNYNIVDDGGAKINVTKFGGRLFPPVGVEKLSTIKDFRIRDNDILICGYPKTGCHWVYEILHMLQNRTTTISKYGKEFGGMIDVMPDFLLDSIPSPRILNSHLLYDDLPDQVKSKKTKIILTTRSAKDTMVSFYNHHLQLRHVYNYDGTFDNYAKLFIQGNLDYGCYFKFTQDWNRVLKSSPVNDIFMVKFEDLKADPVGMIKKMAKFLDVKISDEFARQIAESSKFSKMKQARSSDPFSSVFYRKGEVGDWKNWLTPDQVEQVDRKWTEVTAEWDQGSRTTV